MAPPFMNSTGLVTKIFNKIISASQPERFTQDFLKSGLGFDSGSRRPFIPLLIRGHPDGAARQVSRPSSAGQISEHLVAPSIGRRPRLFHRSAGGPQSVRGLNLAPFGALLDRRNALQPR
jgi:Family of unknown function (DUF5343)